MISSNKNDLVHPEDAYEERVCEVKLNRGDHKWFDRAVKVLRLVLTPIAFPVALVIWICMLVNWIYEKIWTTIGKVAEDYIF